ncbi:MAG: hypothetical protein ACLUNZ_02930 [Evtepia sp.]
MDSIRTGCRAHIDEEGYLSFGKLGGIRPESILHTPFRFKNGVSGVVSLRRNVFGQRYDAERSLLRHRGEK